MECFNGGVGILGAAFEIGYDGRGVGVQGNCAVKVVGVVLQNGANVSHVEFGCIAVCEEGLYFGVVPAVGLENDTSCDYVGISVERLGGGCGQDIGHVEDINIDEAGHSGCLYREGHCVHQRGRAGEQDLV